MRLTTLVKHDRLKLVLVISSQSVLSAVLPFRECHVHSVIEDCLVLVHSKPFLEQNVDIFLEKNLDMEFGMGLTTQSTAPQPLALVVDDNEDNLLLLTFVLEQLNCRFITAIDGQTALDLAQRYQPALILLDIMLPDLDGFEVFSRLRQNPLTARIPVIAVTAMARPEDQERLLSAGCDEYVTKPYMVDDLEDLLRRYLSR
ncbi:MAG TPA: response regulator [Coleofasciculaceae cyanobacterium]